MDRNKELRLGIILNYINIIAQLLVYVFYTPFALRYLGDSQYGVYSLCTSIMSTLGIIEAGLGSAYLKYYIEYKADNVNNRVEKLNAMFLSIFIALAAIAFTIGMFIASYPEKTLGDKLTPEELALSKELLMILAMNIALTFVSTIFTSNVRANNRYVFLKGIDALRTIFNPFLSIFALLLGYKARFIVTLSLIITIITTIIYVSYCIGKLKMRFIFKDMEFKLLKKYFSFSIFIFIHTVMDQLNWQIDKYILARFCGSIAITVYSLGSQINMIFIKFSTAVSDVFTPRIHALVHSKNTLQLTNLFIEVGRIQLMIVLFIYTGFVIFGKSFIYFWSGGDYTNSYYVALLLMTPIIILLSQNISIEILRAFEKHRVQAIVNLSIGIINVFISIPLCMKFGEVGCALGTMITMGGIYYPFTNYYFSKHTKISLKVFYRSISKLLVLAILTLSIGIVLNIKRNIYSIQQFILFILIYSIIYWVILYVFGFNQEEKQYAATGMRKVKNIIIRKR